MGKSVFKPIPDGPFAHVAVFRGTLYFKLPLIHAMPL